jgi:ubiquinone/menaquinone biosynthesis C-methylase UbiE
VGAIIWATPLYQFLKYCNSSPLEKRILDCGAGGNDPPLQLFYEYGYESYGIEISSEALKQAETFCKENNITLNLLKGDMRKIPFQDEIFSFAYSYNTMPLLSKKDIAIAMIEMERVLKPSGLCFVNFVSIDDEAPADSYFENTESDKYFSNFQIIQKEKRIILIGKKEKQAYIDYIAKKMNEVNIE